MSHDCDVLIIGDGLYALVCSLLLSESGLSTLRVHKTASGLSDQWPGLGVLWSSLNDPPTRPLVAHGHELASYLLDFMSHARNASVSFFRERLQVDLLSSPQLRLGLKEHEVAELNSASKSFPQFLRSSFDGKMIWDEGLASCLPQDVGEIRQRLLDLEPVHLRKQGRISLLEESEGGVHAYLHDGGSVRSEMAVVGAGCDARFFLPRYMDVLVPVQDVISRVEWLAEGSSWGQLPICFRAASGHFSGKVHGPANGDNSSGKKSLTGSFSGPRYGLPGAGIGVRELMSTSGCGGTGDRFMSMFLGMMSDTLAALSPHWGGLIPIAASARIVDQKVRSDCLPCDELPILGQWGTSGRLVGCAGWLGCGHTAACLAAQHSVELVLDGRSAGLHPMLSANRFLGF